MVFVASQILHSDPTPQALKSLNPEQTSQNEHPKAPRPNSLSLLKL